MTLRRKEVRKLEEEIRKLKGGGTSEHLTEKEKGKELPTTIIRKENEKGNAKEAEP